MARAQRARSVKLVDEQVGENIKMRRQFLGMTQDNLAYELDVSYQQVQKYEAGTNRISVGRLYDIAQALEVEIGALFENVGDDRPDVQPKVQANRSNMAIAQNISSIKDPLVRSAVINLIKSLSSNDET